MSKGKEKNCRLCLEFLDNYYSVIEESTKGLFEVLLLKMDLSVSEEPVICQSCMESVQEAFKFKSTCISVNEKVVSFVINSNSAELDIKDVYLKENEDKNLVFNEDYYICRFCLQCLENFKISNDLRNNSTEEMLLKCIPEVDLNIIKEPVVCTACMKSLETYYSFAMKCRNTEENIMKYYEVQGAEYNGQIILSNVLKFLIEGMPECNKTVVLKEENMFQNEENTYSDINNIVVKTEEEKLVIKDVNKYEGGKTEEDRCGGTGQKEVVNYIMLTHKDSSDVVMYMYRCEKCTFETKYKSNIKKHMLTHKDSSEVEIFRCALCTLETKRRADLKRHMLVHKDKSELTMYKCNSCNYETKRKNYLGTHMLTHKDSPDVAIYKCEKCTFETKQKRNLKAHVLTHKDKSELIMHKCNLCSYEAKWKGSLRVHMLTHRDSSGVVKFRCEVCPFETKNRTYLKKHMLVHKDKSELTMYKCNLCSYEAKWKGSIGIHMSTHKDSSDVEKYKCEKCTFETKRKRNLKAHMLTHKDKSEVTSNV